MGEQGSQRVDESEQAQRCPEGHDVGRADLFCPVCLSPTTGGWRWIPTRSDD